MPRKTLHQQIANKCKFFNGIMNKTCEAGVQYDTLTRPPRNPDGSGYLLPCLKDDGCDDSICPKREFQTEAEIQQHIDDIDASFNRVTAARAAICEHAGLYKRGEGKSGVIDCPCCGKAKALHYSRAGVNGHVHARCETPKCVSWLE